LQHFLTLLSLFLGGFICQANRVRGDTPADISILSLGHWELVDGKPQVAIVLADLLTPKQKSMLTGGFTTVSQLSLMLPDEQQLRKIESLEDVHGLTAFYHVRCSVKYDAWLETYDVAKLDDSPQTGIFKELGQYGELCLNVDLAYGSSTGSKDVLDRLSANGGTVLASLVVKQTSQDEAEKIKEWLIQQQSGMMQGLFSHMLGELTLQQSLMVKISVPPKPQLTEKNTPVKSKLGKKNLGGNP
jgi:hypothetical protein